MPTACRGRRSTGRTTRSSRACWRSRGRAAAISTSRKRRHYGFDFCPAFWDWLVEQNRAGRVFSIEKVGDELRTGGDDLAEWADARGKAFFLPPDEPLIASLGAVAEWVRGQHYRPAAIG